MQVRTRQSKIYLFGVTGCLHGGCSYIVLQLPMVLC